jgi:hypothetical protein
MELSEEQTEKMNILKERLIQLSSPEDGKKLKETSDEEFIAHLQMSLIPTLLSSWDATRDMLVNALELTSELSDGAHKFKQYLEAMSTINTFIDSYKPSYIPECGSYKTIAYHGKAEVKGCEIKLLADNNGVIEQGSRNIECSKHDCPMSEDCKPDSFKMVKCPKCNDDDGLCSLCFGMQKVEAGKVCDKCHGTGLLSFKMTKAESGANIIEDEVECTHCNKTGINPDWEVS